MAKGSLLRALVADVGGTKLDFAICEADRSAEVSTEHIAIARTSRVASAAQSSLEAAVSAFLGEERVDVAVLAVAGPVVDGRSKLTNLPWLIDRSDLERRLGVPVDLLNDFAALGYAVPLLTGRDLLPLTRGPRRPAPGLGGATFAVIGAGTGLGMATFLHAAGALHVLAGEGGHADFAPRSELEVRLWRYLHARFGRVSVERVLSGQGLARVYAFLREEAKAPSANEQVAPAEVSRRALDGDRVDPIAQQALALWLQVYGAEAGNLALRVVPERGVFIAGGIAQKLGPRLQGGEFMTAFLDKDPMRAVLERIPVDVIMRPDAGLIGAFARALVLYSDGRPAA